ncbi:MAG: hypothetical protein KKG59_04500 [Nanoarchaeota archaeon]|nr:hypothetical protein [Nanoarchaeota archaeon]
MARRRKRTKANTTKEESPDEDFTFNLKTKKKSKSSSESSFDMGAFNNVFNNKKLITILSVVVLLVIAFGVGWHYRNITNELPITRDWATNNVQTYYKNAIRAQVDQQYPNLPAQSKNEIVNEQYAEFAKQNQATLNNNIDEAQKFFLHNYQDDQGQTYMLNIDSFYWYRRSVNIVETGKYYDSIRDGFEFDDYMLAPLGIKAKGDFHSYFTAYLYKFLRFFKSDIRLITVAFMVSALLGSLSVIPCFFIVRKKVGDFGGFFAALLLVLHPIFLGRSMAGDFDIDAYNIFFPLIIAWIFLEAIEAKSLKNKLGLTVLNGLVVGIFSFAWRGGWWYIFDFVIGVMMLYLWYITLKLAINKIIKRKILKMSELYARGLLFFGPLLLGAILLFIHKGIALVFAGIYALAIIVYFVYVIIDSVKKRLSKKKLDIHNEEILNTLIILIVFVAVSSLFVLLFSGSKVLITGPLSPIRITGLQDAAKQDYWPNVYTTVAELNTTNFAGVISQIGSLGQIGNKYHFFFIIATMGIILGLVKKKADWKDIFLISFAFIYYIIITRPAALKSSPVLYILLFSVPFLIGLFLLLKDNYVDIKYALFLTLWFVATIYAGTKGVRFTILLVPAFCVAFGVTIGTLYRVLTNLGNRELHIPKIIMKTVLIILFLLLLINPMKAASEVAKNHVPIFDRTWYEAMDTINKDSQPDAIINSWWDFGHFFKAIGNRSVTFDGAIQNTPPAHWVGRSLASHSEEESLGILRMLDCGQNTPFEMLLDETDDTIKSIELLRTIMVSSKEEAAALLEENGITSDTKTRIIEATLCEPPENYFVTSGDMVGKAGVWAHFGYWDFKRAYIYRNIKGVPRSEAMTLLKEKFDMDETEADSYYMQVQALLTSRDANGWISPWPGYITSQPIGCTQINRTLECKINLGVGQDAASRTVLETAVINLDDPESSYLHMTAFDPSLQTRLGEQITWPNNFVISGEDGFVTYHFENATFLQDIVVDIYRKRLLITDPLLSQSTFTKLFYFNGMYMEHFDKVFEKQSSGQGNVIVWKVDWDGKTEEELIELKNKWMPKPVEPVEPIEEPEVPEEPEDSETPITNSTNTSE